MGRWFRLGLLVGLVLPIGGGVGLFSWWLRTDRIAYGVQVQGIAIGGLPMTEAQQLLTQQFSPTYFATTIVPIFCQGRVVQRLSLADLGIRADVDQTLQKAYQIGRHPNRWLAISQVWWSWREGYHLPLLCQWEESRAHQVLQRLSRFLNRPPQRAQLEWQKGRLLLIPSQEGQQVDIAQTLNRWRHQLARGDWSSFTVVLAPWRPEVTTEDVAPIDSLVGQATTFFRIHERNRVHNIRLAAARLDHLLIRPGETLSFNAVVGPRSPKRGFRRARVIVDGEFTEDFGGGVCQVSSTLYLAALRAGMEVIQRHPHSRPIGYLPSGMDATVNFGSLDLKLRNPFSTPLYLRTFVKGGRLTVLILGKRQPKTYHLVRSVQPFVKPLKSTLLTSTRSNRSNTTVGYQVIVWRWEIANGRVVRKERISVDTFERNLPPTNRSNARPSFPNSPTAMQTDVSLASEDSTTQ